MMSTNARNSASITVEYTENFRKRVVENNSPDGWASINIIIGDSYLQKPRYKNTGFAYGIVLGLLESLEYSISDERHLIELESGPTWVVVEPRDNESIDVAICVSLESAKEPSERLDIERTLPVTKRAWVEEVLDTAYDFRETIVALNPDLRDKESMQVISEKITGVEAFVDSSEINANRNHQI